MEEAAGCRSSTIISLVIGQGELSATPLQLANIEATIANHGYYYKPHLISLKKVTADSIKKAGLKSAQNKPAKNTGNALTAMLPKGRNDE